MTLESILPKSSASKAPPRRTDRNAWAMAGVLVAMWAVLAILPATRSVFLTQGNISTLLTQSAVLLVVSVGMTMVILIRGIDLSVGAGVALTGVIAALAQIKLGLPAPAAIALAIMAGAAIGAFHGFWVGWLGIPAFVVTLAGFKVIARQRDLRASRWGSFSRNNRIAGIARWRTRSARTKSPDQWRLGRCRHFRRANRQVVRRGGDRRMQHAQCRSCPINRRRPRD